MDSPFSSPIFYTLTSLSITAFACIAPHHATASNHAQNNANNIQWSSENTLSQEFQHSNATDGFNKNASITRFSHETRNKQTDELKYYYSIEGDYHDLDDGNQQFDAQSINITAGGKISPNIQLEGGVGYSHTNERDQNQKNQGLTYRANAIIDLGDKVTTQLGYIKNQPYPDDIIQNQDQSFLEQDITQAGIEFRPTPRTRFEINTEHHKLSDGNSSHKNTAGMHYQVSKNKPNLWIGVEGSHHDFKHQDQAYWTPQDRKAIALIMNGDIELNQRTNLNIEGSLGRSKDDSDQNYQTEASLAATLNHSINKHWSGKIGAGVTHSTQDGEEWKNREVNASISYHW